MIVPNPTQARVDQLPWAGGPMVGPHFWANYRVQDTPTVAVVANPDHPNYIVSPRSSFF